MFCTRVNPETNKLYTHHCVCCNPTEKYKLCPVAKECHEDNEKNIMIPEEGEDE